MFIRRATNPRDRHSGQVAFPGGLWEPQDGNAESTALRETEEEIGVSRQAIRTLGYLGHYITIGNVWVSPIVGELGWPTSIRPDPTEVSRVFTMPLEWLAQPENSEFRQRQDQRFSQSIETLYFKVYDGEMLWGATARMVAEFIRLLKQQR